VAVERSRKYAWSLAALTVVLLLALARLARAPDDAPPRSSIAPERSTPRATIGASHEFVVLEPSGGQLVPRATIGDAGVPIVEAPETHAPPMGRLAYDRCNEPLPERVSPPEGLDVVTLERVSVAFDRALLSTAQARALGADAEEALREAADLVGWPAREHLLVVTHASREEMAEALGLPDWPGAAYDGAVHVVAGEHERALRHEIMHAQLHAAAPCVPYWLDEGLASYFEREPYHRAWRWLSMIHLHTWIPFASLAELLARDEGIEEMSASDVGLLYAQSLAMVSMLAEEGGPSAVERAVARSREGVPRHMAWELAMPDVGGEELLAHLARRLFPDATPTERAELRGRPYRCARADADLPVCELHDR
jgi:hypothetical protein